MAAVHKLTVRLSTKGQLILPKSIRQRLRWNAGTRLTVEDTAEGVVLKQAPIFDPASPDEVFGSLKVSGPPKTLEEMDAAILAEAGKPLVKVTAIDAPLGGGERRLGFMSGQIAVPDDFDRMGETEFPVS